MAISMIAPPSLAAAALRPSLYAQDGWLLSVERDAFTGLVRCGLRSRDGRMIYRPGALGLRFGRQHTLMDAWYRVDDGPPHRWQDDYPSLIANGVEIDGSGLTDPTRGVVWLPIDTVTGASAVQVRIAGSGNGRLFRLRGFAAMLDAATRLDCRFS